MTNNIGRVEAGVPRWQAVMDLEWYWKSALSRSILIGGLHAVSQICCSLGHHIGVRSMRRTCGDELGWS